MSKKILILGAGFGGLETASSLSEKLNETYEITLIDKNDYFIIGFTKFEVMFGKKTKQDIKYYYKNLRAKRVQFIQDTITNIDVDTKIVKTSTSNFTYDYLVIALGADLHHSSIPGFVESGGNEFYSLEGAEKLFPVINSFQEGTILLTIFGKPYKCPPAPYEAAIQLHDFFEQKGVREHINLKMIIPGPMPIPISQDVSTAIESLLSKNAIELMKSSKITSIDADNKKAITESGKQIPFDLFIGVPIHILPKVVRESKLGENGFIVPNRDNLETKFKNVYAIGDVTHIPAGKAAVAKAGTLAEDAARSVVADILVKEGIKNDPITFNAIGTCYMEIGGGKVAKINVNFLGGEKPHVSIEGPPDDFRSDKEQFEILRREKWF